MWASHFVRNGNKLSIFSWLATEVQVCRNVGRPNPRLPNLVGCWISQYIVCDILMYFLIPLNLIQSWIYLKKCDSYILFISYSRSTFNSYYYFWMKRVLCKLFNRLVEVKKPPYSMQLLVMMISHNSCACKWEQGRIWEKRGCQLRGEGATQSTTCCTMSMCKRGSVGIWQKMLVDTN